MKIPPTATTTPMNRQTQGNEPPVGDTADNVPSGNSTYGIPSAKSAYVLKLSAKMDGMVYDGSTSSPPLV